MAPLVRLGAAMSLINEVLQDLDRRHASPAGLPTAAPGVPLRALPEPGPSWPKRSLAALAAAALATGAAFAWHSAQGSNQRAMTPTPPMLARPVAAVVTPDAPAADLAAAVVVPLAPATVPAFTEDGPLAPIDAGNEALGTGLRVTPTNRPATEPLAKGSASLAGTPATPAAAVPVVATAVLAPATATAMLDKRARPTTARERAESEYQRGLEMHRQGQDKDAEAAFAKALDEDRGHAPARQALAVAWIGQGRSDEARPLLAAGLALSPQQTALAMLLSRIELDRSDTAAATAVLKTSLDNTPTPSADVAAGRALLATLQQRQGQHGDAIDNFGAALRQEPRRGAWWIGLANSLAAEGRTNSAREAFERARASDDLGPELVRYVEQSLRASPR